MLSDGTQAENLCEVNLDHSSEDFYSNLVRRQNHPPSSFRALFLHSGFLFAFPSTCSQWHLDVTGILSHTELKTDLLGERGKGGETLGCDTLLISCVLALRGTLLMPVSTQHTGFYPA